MNAMNGVNTGLSKVPEVTLWFWIIKIAATTLGETGGDSVTMTFNWGYLAGTALFLGFLIVLVIAQIVAKKFYPFLYWATIVASTTFGTTMADLPIVRWVSATPAVLPCCSCACWLYSDFGIGRGYHLCEHGNHAESGMLLLGCHHLFADARYCPR